MNLGHIIGKVVLSKQEPAYKGGRFLLVQPLSREQMAGAPMLPLPTGNSLVVYDNLVQDEFIVMLPPRVERRYVGKKASQHSFPQDQINQLLGYS